MNTIYFEVDAKFDASQTVKTPQWVYVNNHLVRKSIGWKIHISATIENAVEILNRVSEICLSQNVAFKFVPDVRTLRQRNSKYAELSSAGKFITIYPAVDNEFDVLAKTLIEALKGFSGPPIISDIPATNSPVYFRYGLFRSEYRIDEFGARKNGAINSHGNWIEDTRSFLRIDQVEQSTPAVVQESFVQLQANMTPLPFEAESVLHRSNGGGVYKGTYEGVDCVVKEARPFAGIDGALEYSQGRLKNEWCALKRLGSVPGVVDGIDLIEYADHLFLVEEFIPGVNLYKFVAQEFPFYLKGATKDRYAEEIFRIIDQVKETVCKCHACGVYLNDIHARNLQITPDNNARLIDLETATFSPTNTQHAVATPGTYIRGVMNSREYDLTGVALTLLHAFHPATPLSERDPSVCKFRVHWVNQFFGQEIANEIISRITKLSPQLREIIR